MRAAAALLSGLLLAVSAGCSGPAPGAGVAVEVDHPAELADAPLHVRVTGLAAGERVTVTADGKDASDREWLGFASFRADGRGVVDLASAAPSGGSYRQPESMGLLRSMAATDGEADLLRPPVPAMDVTLTVRDAAGRTLASRRVQRVYTAAGVTERFLLPPDATFFGHYYAPPATGAAHPAVLLFGGAEGGLSPYLDVEAALLASHGFPALAIGYFGLLGTPSQLANVRLEYFEDALTWLRGQPGVDPARLFVSGDSRGSEAALLLGVHRPDLVHGVVALVPSDVVHCSIPDCTGPALTVGGAPVPYTSQFDSPAPTDNPAAVIPVERIPGPVFLVCGESDSIWPSCPYARAMDQRLAARGGTHVLLAYPGADHDVGRLAPEQPDTSVAADAAGRADAWPRLLALLRSG